MSNWWSNGSDDQMGGELQAEDAWLNLHDGAFTFVGCEEPFMRS